MRLLLLNLVLIGAIAPFISSVASANDADGEIAAFGKWKVIRITDRLTDKAACEAVYVEAARLIVVKSDGTKNGQLSILVGGYPERYRLRVDDGPVIERMNYPYRAQMGLVEFAGEHFPPLLRAKRLRMEISGYRLKQFHDISLAELSDIMALLLNDSRCAHKDLVTSPKKRDPFDEIIKSALGGSPGRNVERSAVQENDPAVGTAGGPLVQQVQEKLRDRGFDPGSIDGRTGPKTVEAIRAYQQSVGLKADGRIDMALMERLGIVGQPLHVFDR
jgi:hypothetical protein